ncbi:TcpD family membrane protein [Virgibacillus salexigens]|uniref:TrbC/VirB2 family protein n=1 Tax=Virgibacillus kapii TaxID=1638645 RepID=A0ABQ2E2E9_9BACI|nr:TcpD family membrane protein [Virgibacillus kapii]GGJ77655.1 hypothetical protein GCM10007111_44040 [Virgibacillus kapii]
MNFLSLFVLASASLPTLGTLKDWIVEEGGNAVAIVLVGFAVFYLVKQSWGKLIGFLIVAAVVFFAVGNPEGMLQNLESIADVVLGR